MAKQKVYVTDKGNILVVRRRYGVFYTPEGKFLRFADRDEVAYLIGGLPRWFSYCATWGFSENFLEEPYEPKLKVAYIDTSKFEKKYPPANYYYLVADSNCGVKLYENYYGKQKEVRYY